MEKDIRKNKASLYVDGRMEYQAVNLEKEYGQLLDGCKYAVASYHCKEILVEMYREELDEFSPFIYLTVDEYEAIYESQKNNNKYNIRYGRKHDGFDYDDELTAMFQEIEPSEFEINLDPLNVLLEEAEQKREKEMIDRLPEAIALLSDNQKRRIIKFFLEGKNTEEIAKEEGVSGKSVRTSIIRAKETMKKYLNNF